MDPFPPQRVSCEIFTSPTLAVTMMLTHRGLKPIQGKQMA